ncbi:hypothetical protein AAMO2058_001700100 [Amorphochlora amoebiformis]
MDGLCMSERQYVTTGEVIGEEAGFLRGHGTVAKDGKLQATVSGFVQRVNKLVSVHALNSRYQGEIGDVVVCRILEVADKLWRVDLNSRKNAILMLSAVHLPGGVQRRRTQQDQAVKQDGSIHLHTRSLKYGKLNKGLFLSVPASLIKRCKKHFHTLKCGVDIILGNNGYVWMQFSREQDGEEKKGGGLTGGGGEREDL